MNSISDVGEENKKETIKSTNKIVESPLFSRIIFGKKRNENNITDIPEGKKKRHHNLRIKLMFPHFALK